jgi:SNF2-related domain/Helicase conserved C-terminal domain
VSAVVLGRWNVSGTFGTILLNVEVEIDASTDPQKVGVGFHWEPRENPEGKALVSGPNGLIASLRTFTDLPDGACRYDAKTGRHWFPWTEVHRAGLWQWLQHWTSRGLSSMQVALLVRELNRFTPRFVIPSVTRVPQAIGSIPAGSLIQINGLEHCSEHIWEELRAVPGVFVLTPSGAPQPIASNWVDTFIERRGVKPTPAFVSAIHVDAVARLFPAIRAQQPQIRSEMGLDYAVYPPQSFPVAGRDPFTGHPYHLYEYQAGGVSKFLATKRLVLNLEMGLGKTLCALAAAETLFAQRAIDRCVIISPRRAQRTVWERFLLAYYGRRSVVIDGDPRERRQQYARALRSPYVVTRYDTWRLGDAQIGLASLLGPRTMVVIDECHRVKNPDTARFRAIFEMLEGTRWTGMKYERMPQWSTPYRLLMTGTMVHDKPLDVFGPVQMLGWRVWNSFNEFQRAYFHLRTIRSSRVDKRGQQRTMTKATRLRPERVPDLQGVLSSVTYSKTVADVGLQLPLITRMNLVIDPNPSELAAYRVIKGEVFRYLDTVTSLQRRADAAPSPEAQAAVDAASHNLLATMAMERMFSSDPVLLLYSATQRDRYGRAVPGSGSETADRLVGQIGRDILTAMSPGSKLSALMEWLSDFLQQGRGAKVVVFCSFQRLFSFLQQVVRTPLPGMSNEDYAEFRYVLGQSLFFDGTVTDRQGDDAVRAFTNDPRRRVLFSTAAGGEGQNFQAADYIVHFDEPLSIGDLQQREGRVVGGLRRAGGRPAFVSTMRFAPAVELQSIIDARLARFVDPRIRALLAGKSQEKATLMRGVRS